MVVYLDLIVLTSICFDTSIIMMTAKIRHLRITRRRTCLAAVVGALYTGVMFEPRFQLLYTASAKLLFALLIVYIAFGFGSLQQYFRNLGVFYMVHFAAAGAIFAAHFLLLSSGETMSKLLLSSEGSVGFAIESGLWLALPIFAASLWFLRSVFASKRRTDMEQQQLAQLTVQIGDWSTVCRGFVDTGNQLYDPLSRAPVLVMELDSWRDRLPRSVQRRIAERQPDRIFSELEDEPEPFAWEERLRLIPYRGVGGGAAFMLAIKPDLVTVTTDHASHTVKKALIAIDAGPLSSSGAYQAIIHPMLIQHA